MVCPCGPFGDGQITPLAPDPLFFATGEGSSTGIDDNGDQFVTISNPLPVTFIDFTAKKSGQQHAFLNWSTATEENNKGFHIERSTSGQSWEVIGFVPGHNNSTVEQRYSFTDNNPKPGIINQYRLRQEDFDGRYDYSAVRKVDFSFKEPVGISLFPNPAGGEGVNISCEGFSSKVNVLLFNSNGILVRRLGNVTAQPSTGNINIETASLPPGLYMVEVTDSEGHRAVKKLVRR
ncbi:MAG TPA: T9SS type A sorting domain-containing protein [Chitinophagaceae bacterium]|nr:T9SS type A sorting domain-containing protein [Chitinophagaceae bacterium]